MTNKQTKPEDAIAKTEERPKLCQIHDWDTTNACHRVVGEHTLTYMPPYNISTRSFDDVRTIKICDECYYTVEEDEWGYLVDDVADINSMCDIVIE